jgi:hypothetical protein
VDSVSPHPKKLEKTLEDGFENTRKSVKEALGGILFQYLHLEVLERGKSEYRTVSVRAGNKSRIFRIGNRKGNHLTGNIGTIFPSNYKLPC